MARGAEAVVSTSRRKKTTIAAVKSEKVPKSGKQDQFLLTTEDIERIKNTLIEDRKKHNETIQNAKRTLGEPLDSPHRTGELGTDSEGREIARRNISNAAKIVRLINDTLGRIEAGKYDGICVVCKKPILKERLFAVPVTRKCCACKNGDQ